MLGHVWFEFGLGQAGRRSDYEVETLGYPHCPGVAKLYHL